MTQPDWDDDRLGAAFHARFDRPAPQALSHDIHVRIAGTSPARFRMPHVGHPWSVAAAAVVVVFIGAAMFVPAMLTLPSGAPIPSSGSPSQPGATSIPSAQAVPGSVLGLPIVHVRDAIAIRDAGVDDREIAVQGWFTLAQPRNCGIVPPDPADGPIQLRCPDDRTWLTEEREATDAPTGPALNPMVPYLDLTLFPQAAMPVDVVFVGHFDDRRADSCQDAEIPTCRDRFVVDSVAYVDGVEQPTSRLRMTDGVVSTDAEIEAIIANEAPDSPILSMSVVDTDEIASIEPTLGPLVQGLVDHPDLWVIRVLESERAVTYIVIDGSDAIYEMNPAGEPVLVGGEPPHPETSASPTAWPPRGAIVVDLTDVAVPLKPPVQVAVVDTSGRLVGAVEATEPNTMTTDGRFGAYGEPGKPGRVNLTWIGGACDSQITVTIGADLRTISFDMGPQPNCDSIGVGRHVVLDFTGSVDVPAIQIGESGINSPAPSEGLDYELDCGPLGPDTCETRAAEIVAANLALSPPRRVVSLVFETACGSWTAVYDDGTGSGADIDCIASPEPT